MRRRDFNLGVLGGVLGVPALLRSASAEVATIRIAKQYGLPYLPMMVMERRNLVEKHAAQQGVRGLQVVWQTLGGTSALNDVLLSGQTDFINVGVPALVTLWDKTAGTAQEVRGLSAVQSMPFVLATRNAKVGTIADFTETDRIALPAVKISAQAVALEMAAAKLWGFERYDKLDALTVTLPHPEALAALLSGKSEVNSHYTVSPFYHYELATPGIHQVLKSYDTFGRKHTNGVQLTTGRFYDANPKICAAVLTAQDEANAFIKANPRDAAEIYIQLSGDARHPVDEVARMIADPDVDYTTTPAVVMEFAGFMHKVGRTKRLPGSWQDLFFPGVHRLPGS